MLTKIVVADLTVINVSSPPFFIIDLQIGFSSVSAIVSEQARLNTLSYAEIIPMPNTNDK